MDSLTSKDLKYYYPDGPRLVSLRLQNGQNESQNLLIGTYSRYIGWTEIAVACLF
jgi:hypothetical protein